MYIFAKLNSNQHVLITDISTFVDMRPLVSVLEQHIAGFQIMLLNVLSEQHIFNY